MKPSTLRVVLVNLSLALGVSAALVAGGCGQLTGLSNDYTYDLAEGGDASKGDGAVDGAADAADAADASDAGKCSTSAANTTEAKLAQAVGSATCKSCLAYSCCTTVDTCVNTQSCKQHLFCVLDCTSIQAANDRASCLSNNCNNGGGATALFTNGVGQCAGVACKAECGF
jgi:hypothetical protein